MFCASVYVYIYIYIYVYIYTYIFVYREREREGERERESERETFTCNRVHLSMHKVNIPKCARPACWGVAGAQAGSTILLVHKKCFPCRPQGQGDHFGRPREFVWHLVWWSSSGSGGRGQDGCAGSSGVVGSPVQVVFGVAGPYFGMVNAGPCEIACPGWSLACGEVATSVCSLWRVHHKRLQLVASSPYQLR